MVAPNSHPQWPAKPSHARFSGHYQHYGVSAHMVNGTKTIPWWCNRHSLNLSEHAKRYSLRRLWLLIMIEVGGSPQYRFAHHGFPAFRWYIECYPRCLQYTLYGGKYVDFLFGTTGERCLHISLKCRGRSNYLSLYKYWRNQSNCKDCFRGLIQEVGSNIGLMQQVGGSSVPHAYALKVLMLSNSSRK